MSLDTPNAGAPCAPGVRGRGLPPRGGPRGRPGPGRGGPLPGRGGAVPLNGPTKESQTVNPNTEQQPSNVIPVRGYVRRR